MIVVGVFALCSTIATLCIMLLPDTGAQVALSVIFGLLFGIPWVIKNLYGIVIGLFAGIVVAVVTIFIDSLLQDLTGLDAVLVSLIKWVFPICCYTAVGSSGFALSGSDA